MPTPSYDTDDLLPTTSLTQVAGGTGLDPFNPIDTADALGLKYIAQEGSTPRVYDGTTMNTISGTAPGTFSVAAITAAVSGFTAKVYYTVVYLDPLHEEYCTTGPYADLDDLDLFPYVTPSAQDVICTISDPPASEPRLVRARVFKSLNETADMRQLTGTGTYSDITVSPGSGGVHGFTDGGAVDDDELSTRDPINLRKRYFADGLPPKTHTLCFFEGRLWGVDPANGNLIFSEQNLPEDIPTDNFLPLLPSDGDTSPKPTAVRVNNNQLMAYTESGAYLISGSAPPFRVRALFRNVGAIATQPTIYADEGGIVFPSYDAIYIHPGGSQVSRLGAPRQWPGMNPLQDLYAAIDSGRWKSAAAMVDPERTLFSLAVALADGDAVNTGGFEWEFTRSNWAKFFNRVVTAYGFWANVQGRYWPVFGDDLGAIWQAEMGNSEGVFQATYSDTIDTADRNTVTGVGPSTITVTKGAPVLIRDATTTEVLYRNRVLSRSGLVYTMLYPWPMADPNTDLTGHTIEIGSIEGVWESGWWSLTRDMARCHLNYIYPYPLLKTGGTMRVLCGVDQNETLRAAANAMSLTSNIQKIAFNDWGNQGKVRFEESAPGTDWGIFGMDMEVTRKSYRV